MDAGPSLAPDRECHGHCRRLIPMALLRCSIKSLPQGHLSGTLRFRFIEATTISSHCRSCDLLHIGVGLPHKHPGRGAQIAGSSDLLRVISRAARSDERQNAMAGSTRITTPTSSQCGAARGTLVRMTFVIVGSIAILVALPGWLRSLENAPRFLHVSHPVEVSSLTGTTGSVKGHGQPVATVNRDALHQQALADFISKRYRVSTDAVQRFIHLAYSAGQMTKLDPLLILAVMAVESSFNPIAESGMGAKGLMQVIPEYHQDKLRAPHGGELNVLDPETNILVGAKVLREYASRTGGDFMAALGLYSGNGPNPDNPYAVKVFSERERLEQSLRRALQRSVPQPLPTPSRT